jgi:hypothetical protein
VAPLLEGRHPAPGRSRSATVDTNFFVAGADGAATAQSARRVSPLDQQQREDLAGGLRRPPARHPAGLAATGDAIEAPAARDALGAGALSHDSRPGEGLLGRRDGPRCLLRPQGRSGALTPDLEGQDRDGRHGQVLQEVLRRQGEFTNVVGTQKERRRLFHKTPPHLSGQVWRMFLYF